MNIARFECQLCENERIAFIGFSLGEQSATRPFQVEGKILQIGHQFVL